MSELKESTIHPTAVVGKNVKMGKGNTIGPYCIIYDGVEIGDGNLFQSHTIIGSGPEHRLAWPTGTNAGVKIGNNNRFNELVTVNGGYERRTQIGHGNYFLRGSHIGHDCIIEEEVGIHCNVICGGYSIIMNGAYLGLGSVLNPKTIIGAYSLIGSNSLVLEKQIISPFTKWAGTPAKYISENIMKKNKFLNSGKNSSDIDELQNRFKKLLNIQ